MKIGITQRGDACLDLTWIQKLNNIDGAIIISKNFSQQFDEALLDNKDKIIYHSTITCLGNSVIQQNVPDDLTSICHLQSLISRGFPKQHIVVRIDPIIPNNIFQQMNDKFYNRINLVYKNMVCNIIETAYQIGIRRFRYSFLDLYKHVAKRFNDIGIQIKQFKDDEIQQWVDCFLQYEKNLNGIIFQSCAQNKSPQHHKCGCVSQKDFEILNIKNYTIDNVGFQRTNCLCHSAKTELLNNKFQCRHKCLYCYWKDQPFEQKLF